MNIQIDTKNKVVQFLDEFTFKDINELKNYIPNIEDWKIVPFVKTHTVTVNDNLGWGKRSKNAPFWTPTMMELAEKQGKMTVTTLADYGLTEVSDSFKKTIDKIDKGLKRDKITDFNNYDNKPEY